MAGATYFEMGPEQLLGVHGLASSAGAPSHLFVRTLQHTGHPHPVLVLINLGLPPLITGGALLRELGARLLPALSVQLCLQIWPAVNDADTIMAMALAGTENPGHIVKC